MSLAHGLEVAVMLSFGVVQLESWSSLWSVGAALGVQRLAEKLVEAVDGCICEGSGVAGAAELARGLSSTSQFQVSQMIADKKACSSATRKRGSTTMSSAHRLQWHRLLLDRRNFADTLRHFQRQQMLILGAC